MRRVRTASTALLLALGLILLSRGPFLFHNTDWGPRLYDAHCFLFSTVQTHADRRAIDPDAPFWLSNPEQLRDHYHWGAVVTMVAIKALVEVSGIRSILWVKVLGIFYTALFALSLTWAMWRLGGDRRPALWMVPLALLTVPPVFLLWVTLFPQGHYFETHLIHALFLPFMVAAVDRRLPWWAFALAGCLGGVATAFVVTNAVFPIGLLGYIALDAVRHRDRWRSWGSCVISAVAGTIAFCVITNPFALKMRLEQTESDVATGLMALLSGDLEYIRADLDPWFAWIQHVDLFFGVSNTGFVGTELPTYSVVLGHVVLVLFGCGAVYGAAQLLRFIVRAAAGRESSRLMRFVGLHALLTLGFSLAYALIGPGIGKGSIYNSFYAVPCYIPMLVCTGAFVAAALEHRVVVFRYAARLLVLASAVVLVIGWFSSYRALATPRFWPEDCVCDSRWFLGYFTIQPKAQVGQTGNDGSGFGLNEGIDLCTRSKPGSEDACVYMGYLLAEVHQGEPVDCNREPSEYRPLCARAEGASRCGCQPLPHGTKHHTGPHPCLAYEGELRDSCMTGAFHGDHIGSNLTFCLEGFRTYCDVFDDPVVRASCDEQIGAFAYFGDASFPTVSSSPPEACGSFPTPWQGLCERAIRLADQGRADEDAPFCEDVYVDEYLRELPVDSQLEYDICLTASRLDYPWCAIGLARLHGETDCRWKGTPEPFGQALYVPPL